MLLSSFVLTNTTRGQYCTTEGLFIYLRSHSFIHVWNCILATQIREKTVLIILLWSQGSFRQESAMFKSPQQDSPLMTSMYFMPLKYMFNSTR